MENAEIPIIAAVNGFALVGGTEIADVPVISFTPPKTPNLGSRRSTWGIIPGFGGTQRLARLVGKGWARDWCLLGR